MTFNNFLVLPFENISVKLQNNFTEISHLVTAEGFEPSTLRAEI